MYVYPFFTEDIDKAGSELSLLDEKISQPTGKGAALGRWSWVLKESKLSKPWRESQ